MDWYVESSDLAGHRELRKAIAAYCGRHGGPDADIDGAELIASELISNGANHAGGPLWVSLAWPGEHPILAVADLGPGFELQPGLPADPGADGGGRGLHIVSRLARQLSAQSRRAGGTVVTAVLPIRRAETGSDTRLPQVRSLALPSLEEAATDGAFGKEPFLRALVVQLAQAIELLHGPTAAEEAIVQVGTDVGGQMEAEYRLASDIVDRMSPEQMGDCYVRLKHAIDGRFSVVEATTERIVLVNDACPFGDVVQRAPTLCHMTSSVFGGIAARNSGSGAKVVLEERIALGDPQCRVVVHLDADADDAVPWAHTYRAPLPAADAG